LHSIDDALFSVLTLFVARFGGHQQELLRYVREELTIWTSHADDILSCEVDLEG
jgi:hypothetical protein